MNINLNTIITPYNNLNKCIFSNNQSYKHKTEYDSFTKISFGNTIDQTDEFSQKINAFSGDLTKFSDKDVTNIRKIQQLVNKYVNGIKVNEQKRAYMVSGIELGTTVLPLTFNDGKIEYIDKELQINTQYKTKPIERKANLIHEFTHICQSETEYKSKIKPFNDYIASNNLFDDYSEEEYPDFDEYLSNHPEERTLISSLTDYNNASRIVEKSFRDITRSIIFTQPQPNSYLFNMGKLISNQIGESVDEYVDRLITKQYKDLQKSYPNCDKKLFYNFLITHMQSEKEAYKVEHAFLKKNGYHNSDFEMSINDYFYSKVIQNAEQKINQPG